MKTGTEIFNEMLKKTVDARKALREVQETLKSMTRKQIAQLEEESPEMFEALLGTVTSAIVELEDWGEPDDVFNYDVELKTFKKEIGTYQPMNYYKWDEDGWYTNDDDEEEYFFGFDQEVFIYLLRNGKMQVEAFGDIEVFDRGEYKKVRKFIHQSFHRNGYNGEDED